MLKTPITTAEEALEEALKYERLAKTCGNGDPYFRVAMADRDFWFREALRLENNPA